MPCCKSCWKKKEISEDSKNEEEIVPLPDPQRNRGMSVVEMSECAMNMKTMYALTVKVMQNFLGSPIYPFLTEPKNLYPYILFLCGEEIAESCKKLPLIELDYIKLTVLIKDAKVVHPKYSDFSRVFCKLRIPKGKEVSTRVKDMSVDLIWDEVFVFDINEYETSVLTIEVWSILPRRLRLTYTEEQEKEEKDASKKGTYKIGEINYPIKSVPCLGKDLRLPLKSGPRKKDTRGELSLYLELGTKKRQDHAFHLYMNMEILKLCYKKQLPSLQDSGVWKNWLEVLPNSAVTLVQQHALQNGISQTEQCACSWLVASSLKVRQEDRISFEFLHDLLDGLICDILSDKIESYLEESLFRSIDWFLDHSIYLLRNLHLKFDMRTNESANELFYLLKCMDCAEWKSYSSYIDSFDDIAEEGHDWFLSVIGEYEAKLTENVAIEEKCITLKKIIKRFLKNQIILDDIFQRAWSVNYSSITYNKLDKVFAERIKPGIKGIMQEKNEESRNRVVEESLKMLQLYHCIRNLVNHVVRDLPSERVSLCMDEYSSWFGEELILEWFHLCDTYTLPFIRRAVLLDNLIPQSKVEPHGTSIKDISSIIDEMVMNVWTKMNWEEQFNTHGALIKAVRTCVMNYSTELFKRITSENFFCEKYSFFMNSKLCVALNNAFDICEEMNRTKHKIRNVLKSSKLEYGFSVVDTLSEIEIELHIAVCNIFLCVFNLVDKQFRRFTRTFLLGFGTKYTSLAIADTCSYMEDILDLLHKYMKPPAFYIVLRHLWLIVVRNLRDGLSFSKGWACLIVGRKSVYMHALQTLNQMKEIFYCGGQGLSYPVMCNQVYEELKEKIEVKLRIGSK